MADLKFKDLVAEAQERRGVEPLHIDLGDGKKAIVLEDVPLRMFTTELEFPDTGNTARVMMDLLERAFSKKDWPRVKAVLEDAPADAANELFRHIFDHFGLIFSDGAAGKDSEDSDK